MIEPHEHLSFHCPYLHGSTKCNGKRKKIFDISISDNGVSGDS